MHSTLLLFGFLTLTSPAPSEDIAEARTKLAQMVALAELASQACSGLHLDAGAVSAFLKHAGMSEGDVATHYAEATRAVADDFATSLSKDENAACSQVRDNLGEGGLGLLKSQK